MLFLKLKYFFIFCRNFTNSSENTISNFWASDQLEQKSEKDAKDIYEAIEHIVRTFEKAEYKDESLGRVIKV